MQSIYPVVSETVLPLNDDLEIRYSVFIDGESYDRRAGSYRIWECLPFVEPLANETIAEAHRAGIQWGCYEHVSVAIGGTAEYVFSKPNGTFIQQWAYGSHNVDNGLGYLPTDDFSRTFGTGFELCCIIQKIFHQKEGSYRFEVLTSTKVLDVDALFVHHCTGIRKTETDWNVAAGQSVEVEAPNIAIVGYRI